MEMKRTVLVVDDDEIMRDGMRSILESVGYMVGEAKNGVVAKDLLEATAFDLIVSDCQMPLMDGLQLLNFAKANTKSRFLLLAEFTEKVQANHAYQFGADEFLQKPFNKNQFLRAIEGSFEDKKRNENIDRDDNYVQVPLNDFITGSKLDVDLFLRLGTSKYVKVGNKGDVLPAERMEGYVAKGLRWFYMRKQDFAFYVGFNITLANAVHNEKSIECARKLRLTKHVTENLIAQLHMDGLNRDQLEDASNVVLNTMALIMENASTMKLLESLEMSESLPNHSIAVGVWACLIAKKVGWTGHSTFFKIAVASLFHDVGQKEIPQHLHLKQRFEMTPQETQIFESHTLRGREILRSIPEMPEDVAQVAAQHHELWNGSGYPNGLKMDQIHPIARLVAVADQFCELIRTTPKHSDAGLGIVYEMLCRNKRDYDPQFLKKLGEIVAEGIKKAG